MDFLSAYADNPSDRERLYPLFETVFDIPASLLQDFSARGYWDPTYRPYTFLDGGQAIANASYFALPLVVQGASITVAALQSVMTHPQWRGRGLMTQLMVRLLDDIDRRYDAALLFTENPSLYEKYGFETTPEVLFTAPVQPVPLNPPHCLYRIDPFSEQIGALIANLWSHHTPISREFAPRQYSSSFHLNIYTTFWQERLHYAPSLDALLIFEVSGQTLILYDVIASNLPTMEHILRTVGAPVTRIETHFNPDQLRGPKWSVQTEHTGLYLMMRGALQLPANLKYPELAHF